MQFCTSQYVFDMCSMVGRCGSVLVLVPAIWALPCPRLAKFGCLVPLMWSGRLDNPVGLRATVGGGRIWLPCVTGTKSHPLFPSPVGEKSPQSSVSLMIKNSTGPSSVLPAHFVHLHLLIAATVMTLLRWSLIYIWRNVLCTLGCAISITQIFVLCGRCQNIQLLCPWVSASV